MPRVLGACKHARQENRTHEDWNLWPSICLQICCYFPLLVLKGIYHYWTYFFIFPRGVNQMEGAIAGKEPYSAHKLAMQGPHAVIREAALSGEGFGLAKPHNGLVYGCFPSPHGCGSRIGAQLDPQVKTWNTSGFVVV